MPENPIDPATFDALKETADADFIVELIDTFLDDAPNMLKDLRTSLLGKEEETFRRTAHSLKSNSFTFGALALGELAKELEVLAREHALDRVGNKLDNLMAEYARVETALKGLKNA